MNRKGFTLVEILIVVIILGILAAIVIPQFTEASNDARESALKSDLQTLRSQLELYKVQHHDNYPNYEHDGDDWVADADAANFVSRLTERTNAKGTVMPDGGDAADYPFGPYLQKMPSNPFALANDAAVDIVAADPAAGTTDGDPGWYFSTASGTLGPNDPDHDDM